MSASQDLLIEIGTEELPPRALRTLADAFRDGLSTAIDAAGLEHGAVKGFATPRRLAVRIDGLAASQPDREVELKGPPVRIAFDKDGNPTKAAQAFANKCGVAVDALQRVETPKGEWLLHKGTERGQPSGELLAGFIAAALDGLPIPRRMRWGDSDAEFVRPVHSLLVRLGDDIVAVEVLGIRSSGASFGHRFHAPGAIEVPAAADYERLLEEAHVIADFDRRKEQIRAGVVAAAAELGGNALIREDLLDEVTALVEWPVPVVGRFDERFLALPAEVLTATMENHQRYFPVCDNDGKLLAGFITVSNIDSTNPALVRRGNERVVRPRLADAEFFFAADRKTPLAKRVEDLGRVVFQKKLGSLGEKSARVAALASDIATSIGANTDDAQRAATLAKTDLLTDMVGEFPELQGTMGRHYATHDGEPAEVALALEEQYLPRFAGDALPTSTTGAVLALADKLDTIAGIFAIGERPSGARDPFGLRRGALGFLRIAIERELDIDLRALISRALALQPVQAEGASLADDVYDYLMERLRAYYLESGQGFDNLMFDAVLARRPARPLDFHQRMQAVREFAGLDSAQSLAAANKRIANILRQAEAGDSLSVDAALFSEAAESKLHGALDAMRGDVEDLLVERRYREALVRLSGLRDVVDEYFDAVMVMCDDPAVRSNRLALLGQLRELFLRTADISRLGTR